MEMTFKVYGELAFIRKGYSVRPVIYETTPNLGKKKAPPVDILGIFLDLPKTSKVEVTITTK